jgi:hypothetical protein
MGRTVDAVMARSLAELGGCFALEGGLEDAMDGEGDAASEAAPLVWMPGGTGRFILVGTGGGGTAVAVTAAVVTLVGAIVTPDARRRACCGCFCFSHACGACVAASTASIYLRRNC